MLTINPKSPLVALDGNCIRRIAVDWREALATVASIAERASGAPLHKVLEATAQSIGQAEGTGMVLADAVADAMLSSKSAQECSGAEKLRRWELAVTFTKAAAASEMVELKAEDLVFIDTALAETYKPAVYGPAHEALNGVSR